MRGPHSETLDPDVAEKDVESVETITKTDEGARLPWHVILYNDDVHAFDQVVLQVMKATSYSLRRSVEITLEAHKSGRAGAYSGTFERCLAVQLVLNEISLITEIAG